MQCAGRATQTRRTTRHALSAMSSLAATQADGYHIPEDYYTSGAYKKKSISQFNGSKGHNQYLQRSVVRFELPFDGFCTKCDTIVGKGTRFNAHKAHVDDYFSSRIYEFTTKCRSCADWYVIYVHIKLHHLHFCCTNQCVDPPHTISSPHHISSFCSMIQ